MPRHRSPDRIHARPIPSAQQSSIVGFPKVHEILGSPVVFAASFRPGVGDHTSTDARLNLLPLREAGATVYLSTFQFDLKVSVADSLKAEQGQFACRPE